MAYRILLDSQQSLEELYLKTQNPIYQEGEWIQCKNILDFTKVIVENQIESKIMPELISYEFGFGFDIVDKTVNPRAETGVDAIQWLIKFCIERRVQLPDWFIHTEDPTQKYNMSTILRNSKEMYKL